MLQRLMTGLEPPAPLRVRLIAHTRCEDHFKIYLIDGRLTANAPLARPDVVRCRVDKCPGVALRFARKGQHEGTIEGSDGVRLNGLCLVHFENFAIYGGPWKSDVLSDNEDCLEKKCHEPAMVNKLCLRHSTDRGGILDARRVLAMIGENNERVPRITNPNRDTWRVLKEISAIRDGQSEVPQVPRNADPLEFGIRFVWGLGASREQVLWWAHRQSPYFIAKALKLDERAVSLHKRYLMSAGLIVEDDFAKLPGREIIAVREATVSKETRRVWVIENAKHRLWDALRYSPGYTVVRLPNNLPRAGEVVYFPVLGGPGIVSPEHQGRVWTLTDDGAARLRDWDDDLRADQRRLDEARFARRLGIAALGVGLASLVSMTADAPQAWDNVGDSLRWLGLDWPGASK